MKKLFLILTFILSFSLAPIMPKAYVVLTALNDGSISPVYDNRIVSPSNSWGSGTRWNWQYPDPWFLDAGQFFTVSNGSGSFISVTADYYVGIALDGNYYPMSGLTDYLSSSRNTLQASNLRCGLASSYGSGYDSTYAPSVTDFKVELTSDFNPSGNNYHYTLHIKYNYFQQIIRKTGYSGNASCWFERANDIDLWGQGIGFMYSNTEFYYYNKTFNFNLSLDPNTAILDSIEGQNNTIINQNETQINQNKTIIEQNNQTNQNLEDIQNSLTDESSPSLSGLQNSAGWLPPGPIDSILNLPLALLNNLTVNLEKSCNPVVATLPFVNKEVTLPCISTIYEQIGISSWIEFVGTIASAIILFKYLMNLYSWVDKTLTFRENNYIDNWGGV